MSIQLTKLTSVKLKNNPMVPEMFRPEAIALTIFGSQSVQWQSSSDWQQEATYFWTKSMKKQIKRLKLLTCKIVTNLKTFDRSGLLMKSTAVKK